MTEAKGSDNRSRPPRLTREAVSWLAFSAGPAGLRECLARLLRDSEQFDVEAADRVFDFFRELALTQSDPQTFWDTVSQMSAEQPLALWVAARRREEEHLPEKALMLWNRLSGFPAGQKPEVALTKARLLARLGRGQEGWEEWHRALRGQVDPHLIAKAAKTALKLRSLCPPLVQKKVRVALLSSTTTGLFKPILEAIGLEERLDLEIWEAPYGNYRQQILQGDSELFRFKPEIVLLMTDWREAGLADWNVNPSAEAQRVVQELQDLWKTLLEKHPCRIIQHCPDVPGQDSYASLASRFPEGRIHLLRDINRRLMAEAPAGIILADTERLSNRLGQEKWFDASQWFLARQYPSLQALPEMARMDVALIRASLGLARKVLVLDLDNTLWNGVIGEDGLQGIQVGPPSPAGEAHQALQKYALELRHRGILLAVCSKNNEMDARLPFEQHDGMILKLDDFVVFRANWQDKPANVREMAATLNLGIDSFVFVDDNPVERDLMRRELPEVAVPEIGTDPAGFVDLLDRQRYFEALSLSAEDRERHRSYQANARREELKQSSGSLEAFLGNLQMVVTSGPVQPRTLDRVVQLINKTNQFNVTTRRYAAEEVTRMVSSEHWWTRSFKLSDRYGDNGLVGVLMARATDDDSTVWEIDTFLMSCRVIGRRMEDYMLSSLLADLDKRGVKRVIGVYVPTQKNSMVADLYPRLGFTPQSPAAGEGAAQRFELSVPFPRPVLTHMTETFDPQPENSRSTP